jgi:hypothetical protein
VNDDGLNIRWLETAPDRSLVPLALDELNVLHTQWPGTVQCEIVIERAGQLGANMYRVSVDIDFGLAARTRGGRSAGVRARASEGAEAQAVAASIQGALRTAFAKLHGQPRATIAA